MKIDRRFFVAASVSALLCASPALAKLRGAPSSTSSFFGNPNVTISAINTSPSTVVITGDTSINAANGLSGASNLNPASGTNQNGYMVKNLSSVTGLYAGMKISGTGIASNTVIIYVDSLNNFLFLDQPATATGTGVTLTCGGNAICCSRIVGNTPAVFHVSADFIAATGSSFPYQDLQYSWNFGDNSVTAGTRLFTRPTDGATIDPNTGQIGPEAAYIYDTPGTYIITLTITGKSAGGYITTTATQQVTVNDFTLLSGFTDRYFDSVNGNDGNSGLTPALAKQSLSAIQTVMATQKNIRVNLANGSSWTSATTMLTPFAGSLKFYNTAMRIRNYNPSAGGFTPNTNKPILLATGSGAHCINVDNGSGSSAITKWDLVISGLNLQVTGGGAGIPIQAQCGSYGIDMNGPLGFCYVLDCDTLAATGGGFPSFLMGKNNASVFGAGFWNTTMGVSSGTAVGSNCEVRSWVLNIGNTYSGNGTDVVRDHFIYPNCKEHSIHILNTFSPGAVSVTGRGNCINGNYNSCNGNFEYSRCHFISQNFMAGTSLAIDAGTGVFNIGTWSNGVADWTMSNGGGNNAYPPVGARVQLLVNSAVAGSVVPTGYTAGNFYYVVASSSSSPFNTGTVQLSGSPGGAPITPTTSSASSGTVGLNIVSFTNHVVERNLIQNISNGLVAFVSAQNMCVRYNRIFNFGAKMFGVDGYQASVGQYQIYFNKCYGTIGAAGFAPMLADFQGTGWARAQTVTDNIMDNEASNGATIGINFTEFGANSSLLDRQTWYMPNRGLATSVGTGTVFGDITVLKTFAQYKAAGFGANDNVANPATLGWTIPPTQWSHFGS